MEALYLKKVRNTHIKEITKLLRITEPTLLSYLRGYKEGGIGKLKELTLIVLRGTKTASGKFRDLLFENIPKKLWLMQQQLPS
jgi:hypothetical protein